MPIVVAPIAGVLAERIGGRPLMALGLALEAVAFGWLALVVEPAVPYGSLVVPFVLGGVGLGLFFAPVAHVILGSVRLEEEGQASGANNAIRQVGGVVGVSIMTTIFTANGDLASPTAFVDGLVPPLWFGSGVLVVGAVVALLIPSHGADDEAVSMTSSIPAVGGFTPGSTVVMPTLRLDPSKPHTR
jgi:MFS family permease